MAEAIQKFIEEKNRPLSAVEIQNGIQEVTSKSALQKILDKLVKEGKIREKVYGKQKIYLPPHNVLSSKEIREQTEELDRKLNSLQDKIQANSSKLKECEAKFSEEKGKLSLHDALDKKVKLECEVSRIKKELKQFEGVNVIPADEKASTQKAYNGYMTEFKKRKRICQDIVEAIMDSYPKTKKHLLEEIGLETDEEVGFSLDKIKC